MTRTRPLLAAIIAFAGLAAPALAEQLDAVTFGTNWLAQGEHGGFYQALADGTYERFGLDVTIRPGGPQSPGRQLLVARQIDFYMGSMATIDATLSGVPVRTVAAIFQRDPQVLIAHPDSPFETLGDLAGASKIIMGQATFFSGYFPWLKANFEGFSDALYEPYTFNAAPFLADPMAVQQGYLTSEPFAIESRTGWAPKVFLLADYGYSPYSTTIETHAALIEENPDLVQRFVDASIIGWYTYLYGENAAANALIKADNPEMTDALLANSLAELKAHDIVVSGDAAEFGIGCMTEARWTGFYQSMAEAGVYEAGADISGAYSTAFVCRGVGLDLVETTAD